MNKLKTFNLLGLVIELLILSSLIAFIVFKSTIVFPILLFPAIILAVRMALLNAEIRDEQDELSSSVDEKKVDKIE